MLWGVSSWKCNVISIYRCGVISIYRRRKALNYANDYGNPLKRIQKIQENTTISALPIPVLKCQYTLFMCTCTNIMLVQNYYFYFVCPHVFVQNIQKYANVLAKNLQKYRIVVFRTQWMIIEFREMWLHSIIRALSTWATIPETSRSPLPRCWHLPQEYSLHNHVALVLTNVPLQPWSIPQVHDWRKR